jgi:hypothetical protein
MGGASMHDPHARPGASLSKEDRFVPPWVSHIGDDREVHLGPRAATWSRWQRRNP